ncbi:MAG: bifunctional enoyl-CoA hydratase/phosphate acetyltransferase [Maricaulaceae bacterium]
MTEPALIENIPYDDLQIGQSASTTRTLTGRDIALFAALSGDVNPAHLDADYAKGTVFHDVIGHGLWGGALISAVLGVQLPGPGTVYLSQSLNFHRPVRIGDAVTFTVTVKAKGEKGRVTLDCACLTPNQEPVITGEAVVIAPREKVRRPAPERPQAVLYERGERIQALIEEAAQCGPPVRVAIAHPVNAVTLDGVAAARGRGLMTPVLVGPRAKIEAAAAETDFDLSGTEIVDAPHSHAAADAAVALAREGGADALMKGALHTDELMGAVVARAGGLRTARRVCHVYVMDTPAYEKLLFISDAAVNIAPDLEAKADIVQNAIDVAQTVGVAEPKVAVLSAVETVDPKMASTLDAAALCKMADRGQITGGVVDGPLAFDNAISREATAVKHIISPVAGQADVLIAPNLEAGNMIAKQLDYLAGAVAAGLVVGARVPIILTSRAEGALARLAASAVAKLYACNIGDKRP